MVLRYHRKEDLNWRILLSLFCTMQIIILAVLISSFAASGTKKLADGRQNSLIQCFSTSALVAQTNGKIVCPQGSTYCIKEVVNATRRSDCGIGMHSSDVWDAKLGQCVYRKCGSVCPSFEEDQLRDFVETDAVFGWNRTFSRTSFCCNETNLCNSSSSNQSDGLLFSITIMFVMACLLIAM